LSKTPTAVPSLMSCTFTYSNIKFSITNSNIKFSNINPNGLHRIIDISLSILNSHMLILIVIGIHLLDMHNDDDSCSTHVRLIFIL